MAEFKENSNDKRLNTLQKAGGFRRLTTELDIVRSERLDPDFEYKYRLVFNARLHSWFEHTFRDKYIPQRKYIYGIYRKFHNTYSRKSYGHLFSMDDLESECLFKLIELKNKGMLEYAMNREGETKRGRITYPYLADVIKNHLINYANKTIRDSQYGTASLDEAEEENPKTGAPKNIKNTKTDYETPKDSQNIKDTDCRTCTNFIEGKRECKIRLLPPGKIKHLKGQCSFYKGSEKPEVVKYASSPPLNTRRLLLYKYHVGKSVIINLNSGFVNVGEAPFVDDAEVRIVLIQEANKVMKKLESKIEDNNIHTHNSWQKQAKRLFEILYGVRAGEKLERLEAKRKKANNKYVLRHYSWLRQMIFLCELFFGFSKPEHYKIIADLLGVKYTRYIKRNIEKVFKAKDDILYERQKEIIKIEHNNDSYMLKELEHYRTGEKEASESEEGYYIDAHWTERENKK